MILGLISDIHGNTTALDAVIDDARQLGVEQWWVLGDLVALGPDPVGVLETLERLPHVRVISGNTERYIVNSERPFPNPGDVRRDPDLLERLIEVEASFSWTRGMLAGCGADLVFAGHTHDATDRVVDGIRAVNLGSLSNPHRRDRCATYCVLTSDATGHSVDHRVVDYDHRAELAALDRVQHPASEYIRQFHR